MTNDRTIHIGATVDEPTNAKFEKWAKSEKRSKRAHATHLLQRLTALRETNPAGLAQLGLTDNFAAAQVA